MGNHGEGFYLQSCYLISCRKASLCSQPRSLPSLLQPTLTVVPVGASLSLPSPKLDPACGLQLHSQLFHGSQQRLDVQKPENQTAPKPVLAIPHLRLHFATLSSASALPKGSALAQQDVRQAQSNSQHSASPSGLALWRGRCRTHNPTLKCHYKAYTIV